MTSTSPTDRSSRLEPVPPGCRIVQAAGRRRRSALAAIIAPGREDSRETVRGFVEYARLRNLDLSHLWAVVDEEEIVLAAALAVPSPGKVAMLFTSRPNGTLGRLHAALAIDAAARNLPGVDLTQAILEVDDDDVASAYEMAGFTRLAILSYERLRLPNRPPDAVVWPAGVKARSYGELPPHKAEELFCRALEASYEETLDCPQLRGIRRTPDVLAGHRATGDFDPQLWTLLTLEDRPEGALLLSRLPDRGTHELVYIGLSPHLRGKSLARLLLQHGLRQLIARRARVLTLAVDEANAPARKLYRELGFSATDRRLALIRNIGLNCD